MRELSSEAEFNLSQPYTAEFPTFDFESWHFEAEYPERGFGILRLVTRSDAQLSLQLRLFEESDYAQQDYKTADASVSLVRLKQLAMEMLPGASHLRALILSEPDSLPREQAVAKVEVFSRLLYKELRL